MHQFPENNFQNNETSVSALINALEAFACAETLDETLRVLEEQQAILLSPDTLLVIQMMMSEMFMEGKSVDAKNWRQYLHVLENARSEGIQEVWHTFMTQQSKARQALEALTTASSAGELYQIIMAYQDTLLSDTAFVMLDNTIQLQRALAPPEAVEYWLQLLDFLEDAQKLGIAAAWSIFESQEL